MNDQPRSRSRLSTFVLVAVFAALALGACSAAAGMNLDGRQFVSTSVTQDGAPLSLVPGTTITISFTDGQIGAQAGCNHMGGTYLIDGGRLVVDMMGMTEMGCDQPRHDQDDWLAAFLSSRPTIALNNGDGVLVAGDTQITLTDRELAQPDVELTGRTWTLTSIIDGDVVSSVRVRVVATVEFTADGRVNVEPGCNSGGGSYRVEGSRIHFSEVAMTLRLCEGPANEVETRVLNVLTAQQVKFVTDSDTLTLTAGDRGLQFSAG